MVTQPPRPKERYEFSPKVRNIICLKSGRRCAFPGCNQDLYQKGSIVGIFAHIYPASTNDGPRFDSNYPTKQLNSEENGLLLCGIHHKIVDDHPNEYTAESLKIMKADYERFVKQHMIQDMTNLSFPEISLLLKHLVSSPNHHKSVDWTLIGMDQKINKNHLSESTREYLRIGVLKVQEVKKYIESMDLTTPYYSDTLRAVFVKRYLEIKYKETDPDSVFYGLLTSIEGDSPDFGKHVAALAILTYLFERCEVFEK